MKKAFIFLIRTYQVFKPVLDSILHSAFGFSSKCRFTPSCSEYTIQQVQIHGTISGLFLGFKQLMKCWGK